MQFYNGGWWYYTPANSWMYYNDGSWVSYPFAATGVVPTNVNAGATIATPNAVALEPLRPARWA